MCLDSMGFFYTLSFSCDRRGRDSGIEELKVAQLVVAGLRLESRTVGPQSLCPNTTV